MEARFSFFVVHALERQSGAASASAKAGVAPVGGDLT